MPALANVAFISACHCTTLPPPTPPLSVFNQKQVPGLGLPLDDLLLLDFCFRLDTMHCLRWKGMLKSETHQVLFNHDLELVKSINESRGEHNKLIDQYRYMYTYITLNK